MSDPQIYHVMPNWGAHVTSVDCQCEPRIEMDGRVIVHDAAKCLDGKGHSFFGGECLACGQTDWGKYA